MLIMMITFINLVTKVEPRENTATVDKPVSQIQRQQRFCLYKGGERGGDLFRFMFVVMKIVFAICPFQSRRLCDLLLPEKNHHKQNLNTLWFLQKKVSTGL